MWIKGQADIKTELGGNLELRTCKHQTKQHNSGKHKKRGNLI